MKIIVDWENYCYWNVDNSIERNQLIEYLKEEHPGAIEDYEDEKGRELTDEEIFSTAINEIQDGMFDGFVELSIPFDD